MLFSYISSASFIIQEHFNHSELFFSLIFGLNAIGIGAGSTLTVKFKRIETASLYGAIIMTAGSILQFALGMAYDSFLVYESTMFLMVLGLGLVFSSSTTMSMSEGSSAPGSASAIFGAVGFLFGGIVSPLVGIGNIMSTSSVIIMTCAVICLLFSIIVIRRKGSALEKI